MASALFLYLTFVRGITRRYSNSSKHRKWNSISLSANQLKKKKLLPYFREVLILATLIEYSANFCDTNFCYCD